MDVTAAQALAAAVLGGLGAKVWDLVRDRRRSRRDADVAVKTAEILDSQHIRDELWREIRKLRERLTEIESELGSTKSAYFELLGKHAELKAEHNQLKLEHDRLQAKYDRDLARLASAQTD